MSATDFLKSLGLALLAVAASASAAPGMDALPQPLNNTPVDMEAIARGYSKIEMEKAAQGLNSAPALLVFVSLDMPQATLEHLLDQVDRARGRILIRGLKNGSLRETASLIQKIIGVRKSAFQIDPHAFGRYAITRVPTFVLVRSSTAPCAENLCAAPNDAVRVAGDVSLEYALEHIARASADFRAEADRFIARLKNLEQPK
ncbi:MAG: type-F conjugative transfer system pilin assembly protein TrbC [Betaproteobacteria bacterium]|nr:type-F conjugative transfer system pilin assembly protein TrbC [Betaproteobacteria bacterium]